MTALLRSIQVGPVATHTRPNGEPWTTGYVKKPVDGPVTMTTTNLAGDAQHHRKFHGGIHRAMLCYCAQHYARWQDDYARTFSYGDFGENLTIDGLDEDTVCLGDIYQIGDAQVQVSQPRRPCNQIEYHLQIPAIHHQVARTRRTGWYVRILHIGTLEAGMVVERLARPYPQWTIRAAHDIYDNKHKDPHTASQLAACDALEPGWRERLAQALS